jgi:hypothetical protein
MSKKKEHLEKAQATSDHDNLIRGSKYIREIASKQLLDYVRHAVDPKGTRPAPAPGPSNGYSGMVELVPVKAVTTLTVGTGGFGVAVFDPTSCAACTDRLMGVTSLGTYVGTGATAIPMSNAATTPAITPSRTGFTGAGLTGNTGDLFDACVNAFAAYIKPEGSATTQNGMIYLLEVPNHPGGTSTLTLNDVISHRRTRSVAANQVGAPGYNNVLNYHRQVTQQSGGGISPPDYWSSPSAIKNTMDGVSMVIVVTGDAGTVYSLECYGSFMARGFQTNPTIIRYSDPVGDALWQNLQAHKRMSGWTGSPSLVIKSYELALGRAHAKSLAPHALHEEQKARAALDREKAKDHRSTASWMWDSAKSLAPFVKEVAGLFL